MRQSAYWYGGVNSVVQIRDDVIATDARGALTVVEAREFAVALLEAASALEIRELLEPDSFLNQNLLCEDCGGDYQETGESLTLYDGLFGTFMACEHCHDCRTIEE